MNNKKTVFIIIAIAVLLGIVGGFYYRQVSEERRIKAYTAALDDLAQSLEEKGDSEAQDKRRRDALERSKQEGDSFKSLTPDEMEEMLARYPDLDRARKRVNKAIEARGRQ